MFYRQTINKTGLFRTQISEPPLAILKQLEAEPPRSAQQSVCSDPSNDLKAPALAAWRTQKLLVAGLRQF